MNWRVPHPSLFLGRVGILTLGFAIADESDGTKVKTPTLTSNSTTLGWGTLEIPAGMKASARLTL